MNSIPLNFLMSGFLSATILLAIFDWEMTTIQVVLGDMFAALLSF